MKKILVEYKHIYEMPAHVPDRVVLFQFLVFIILFFVLGFTLSQFIIFLV